MRPCLEFGEQIKSWVNLTWVLLTYNRVIHTVMLKTSMPLTLGNGKTFLWSKYKCLSIIDQCMQKPSAPASSSWTATWDYSPAEIHYRGELTCLFQLCIRSPTHPHIFIQMYTITLCPWFRCLKAKKWLSRLLLLVHLQLIVSVCVCVFVLSLLRPFISSITPVRVPGPSPIVLSTREQCFDRGQ